MKSIAVIAHIDAGKTTLCERLLYFSYAIAEFGNIEEGLTTLDFLDVERKKGITIESSTISLDWKQERLNLIDTPGHIDFGIEVDLALRAVESSLVLISAVDGIEVQTLNVFEKSQKKGLPTIIFINKLDRIEASVSNLLLNLSQTFGRESFAMSLPIYRNRELKGVIDVLNQKVFYVHAKNSREVVMGSIPVEMEKESKDAFQQLIDISSKYDERIANNFLLGHPIELADILKGLYIAVSSQKYMPVYMGSAYYNVGIRQLLNGLIWFTPTYQRLPKLDMGFVFKIQILENQKIYWVKLNQDFSLPYFDFAEIGAIRAEEFQSLNQAYAGSIIGVKLKLDAKNTQMNLGSILTVQGIVTNVLKKTTRSLLQTTLEVHQYQDYAMVQKCLHDLLEIYPSIKLLIEEQSGQWILCTIGELQLQVFYERLIKLTQAKIVLGKTKPVYYEKYKRKDVIKCRHKVSLYEQEVVIEYDIIPNYFCEITFDEINVDKDSLNAFETAFWNIVKNSVLGEGELLGFSIALTLVNSVSERILPTLLHKALYDSLTLSLTVDNFEIQEPYVRITILSPYQYCGVLIRYLEKQKTKIESFENIEASSKIVGQTSLKHSLGITSKIYALTKGLGECRVEYLCYQAKEN